jgi:hypothetical protein
MARYGLLVGKEQIYWRIPLMVKHGIQPQTAIRCLLYVVPYRGMDLYGSLEVMVRTVSHLVPTG